MKKQLLIYYVSFLLFFLLISLARRWFAIDFLAFWVGGAIGAILPDVDHLIYVYFLRPHELTSQRASRMLSQGKVLETMSLLANTRSERTSLIFHTAMFQLVFYVFAFFVLSSSSNLFGRGLVLAFLLHLLIDQYLDFRDLGNITHWLRNVSVTLTRDKTVFYWAAAGLVLILYGFLL
ncbi:hypothetical protein A2803_03325 [Candidatus Woesebacteria bacterium RIFCSPHIGHO2_01_FULL_44_21]|uniref:Uncharacterized protein n=1 Tax=Candidatus Woesebacteria bacterium RIFCSPHIGHO2_01_FULL_44_21 TaxID=1802503 RepID=A0A1F7Z193_9BACT|nr:MAG: hypothetical protein A2803_03325 [Candidatus Woesebacteria bacterium RIFCSPHIGHO2_01_FULL_44_21]OGM69135.1 MAG: hypothetical protein A2897_04915 [Candidatus Woesebacteria bacterium RIFCSPLOWO2_01_FULL_44_24b]